MDTDSSLPPAASARRPRRPRRRSVRDAGPFYASLVDGLPEAIHRTFIEAVDVRDAVGWLRDGVAVPPVAAAPAPGGRAYTPERYFVQALGVEPDRARWIHFGRWKWCASELDDFLLRDRDCDFAGADGRWPGVRAELHATGVRNRGRFHAWFTGDGSHGLVGLFEYVDPVPDECVGPDDPVRRLVPVTPVQDELLCSMHG